MGLRQTTKISIVDQIVNQIKIQIDTGELKTGDKLPSQVEMEKIFCVSRPTLQKAISKLIVMGLVEAQQGKGYFIRQVDDIVILPNVPSPATMSLDKYYQLYEAKMFFDATLAHLAVYNASDDEIAALCQYVEQVKSLPLDSDNPSESGDRFHEMVAEFSHNQLMADFERSLLQLLNEYEHSFIKKDIVNFEKYEILPHDRIAEAIRKRDGMLAYKEAFNHVKAFMVDIGLNPRSKSI